MFTEIELNQFNGTENYYQYWLGFKYTDGVKYLADIGKCYWLLDIIGSYQPKMKKYSIQIWELKVNDDKKAIVTMREDTDSPIKVKQKLDYTDFPVKEIKLFLINGVLILPSEY